LNGRVAHVSHPLFTSYYSHAQVPMRTMLGHLIARLMPDEMVKTQGMPSFGRVAVTSQPNRRMVHLLSYVPERRGTTIDMIEEPIEVHHVAVALREEGRPVKRVYLAPTGQDLPFKAEGGYVKALVPTVPGYAMVVFE